MKQDADLPRVCYRGFTLIETLVVVAVLAMIAVMATPSLVAWHVRDRSMREPGRCFQRCPTRAARQSGEACA
jgi:prepilin-type N-terminal cleavage/methylation domain-containing protein